MADMHNASILRAMRAWLGMDQAAVAIAVGLNDQTVRLAEQGRCSGKTWTKLTSYYASRGLHWREGEGVEPARLLIVS